MCTQHPIEEPCKLDPPWEGPQVIPAQLHRVDNLIFRRLNQFSRANGVEQTTPMHGWIIEYLYRHRDEPVFQRDIEREFSITRSTVTNILQLMERKGYIQRLSVPQDARLKQLVLTEEGIQRHEKTLLSFHQTDDYVAGLLTEEENAELLRLLKKPAASCNFCEYRNWVIVNFLLNCGCRAATVRNILIEDVFLADSQIIFRHTKTHKVQAVPLCSQMVNILRAYMKIRGGKQTDYLFCDEYGRMLTENALRLAITHYNHSRGVEKTSIHLFRHTFARKYLVDCGGNAFTLQKLLGHATLKMTKHYCNIYDADIAKSFDRFSPLAQMNANAERIAKLSARR